MISFSLKKAIAALVIGLAAGTAAQAQDVVQEARDALPEAVRDSGVLSIATSLQWAPFGYVD